MEEDHDEFERREERQQPERQTLRKMVDGRADHDEKKAKLQKKQSGVVC